MPDQTTPTTPVPTLADLEAAAKKADEIAVALFNNEYHRASQFIAPLRGRAAALVEMVAHHQAWTVANPPKPAAPAPKTA